jgi:hypothetical protein
MKARSEGAGLAVLLSVFFYLHFIIVFVTLFSKAIGRVNADIS